MKYKSPLWLPFACLAVACFSVALCFATSPYAVQSLGTQPESRDVAQYAYDSAGGRLFERVKGQRITCNLIGKPESIATPDVDQVEFSYDPKGRYYLIAHTNGVKTIVIDDMEYRMSGDTAKSIVYIRKGAYSPAAEVDTTDATNLQYTYYLRDHQGTALVAAHADGSANRVRRFDPWGLPVSANGVALRRDQIDGDDPGFTGHKTIRSAGLFHANGRVGDPRVGFISPDPILLHGSLISINRYAYGLHNPLTFVDLSGYAPSSSPSLNLRV